MLLGQTLDGMRVWDVIRAAAAVRELDAAGRLPLALDVRPAGDGASARRAAATALYASLYIPNVAGCELAGLLPPGHDIGPDLLNVRRYLDMPQAAAMAIANSGSTPEMVTSDGEEWQYVRDVAARLGWDRPRGVGSRDGR
jgi:hypothetical protein